MYIITPVFTEDNCGFVKYDAETHHIYYREKPEDPWAYIRTLTPGGEEERTYLSKGCHDWSSEISLVKQFDKLSTREC